MPDIKWHYYVNLGPRFKLGAGLQLWTYRIESLLFPGISLEFEVGKFVLQGGLGGGLSLIFGFYNMASPEGIIIPEVSAAYKFGKAFRMGIGVIALHSFRKNIFVGTRKDEFLLLADLFIRWTL